MADGSPVVAPEDVIRRALTHSDGDPDEIDAAEAALAALVAERDALQERAENAEGIIQMADEYEDAAAANLKARKAEAERDLARREREQAVGALTAIRYGRIPQRGQNQLSAADCANFAADFLAELGESKP